MGQANQKDLFSAQSKQYAAFRPSYPDDLYAFIFQHLKGFGSAWDCATGNGQVAVHLSPHFHRVFATDISQSQLNNAQGKPNITYLISPAEKTIFPTNSFDLITVGQALHWFNREQFYREVKRVARRDSLLAVWGYSTLSVDSASDPILDTFYRETIGPYWDNARRLVEEEYRSLRFPFDEITAPKFSLSVSWSLDHLIGYLSSWSATQQYIRINRHDPVPVVRGKLEKVWSPTEIKTIRFPLFLRLLRIS